MVKNPPANAGYAVQSLGWEDLWEDGMATYSSILAWRIPMDRGAWWATVQGVTKSQTQLSMHACIFRYITGTYFFPVCGLSLHFLNSILKAKIFNLIILLLAALGLPCSVGTLSSCGAQASHRGGFSSWGAWALEPRLSSGCLWV